MDSLIANSFELDVAYSKIKIKGGKALKGIIKVDGSKNSLSAILPAMCLQREGICKLNNIPNISDLQTHRDILAEIGFDSKYVGNQLMISGNAKHYEVSKENAAKIRASTLFLGALVTTLGEAFVPLPGGDKIGDRPIDIHLEGLEALGVKCIHTRGGIYAKANRLPLKGNDIFLRYPSVGATENIIIAASLAEGTTTIYNAAMEPEVVDMAILLNKMGAKISGVGTPTIKIIGTKRLHGVSHDILPDRLEVGTMLLAFAVAGGKGIIKNCIPSHSISIISLLKQSGVDIRTNNSEIFVNSNGNLKGFITNALPYPGLPTDLQPLVTAFATQCNGKSTIIDSVFMERFSHVGELRKMGCNIENKFNRIDIFGKNNLCGTNVTGEDIRSVTALIIAGLAASGETIISGIEHLYRGHSDFIGKLNEINADINVV